MISYYKNIPRLCRTTNFMTSIEYYFSLIARLSYFVVYNIQTDEQTEELKIQ